MIVQLRLDELAAKVLLMAAPAGKKVAVRTIEGSIKLLTDPRSEKMRILIIVDNPADALTLVEKCDIKEVNVANYVKKKSPNKVSLTRGCNADAYMGWQTWTRPIVLGTIAGLLCGDLTTGVILGAELEAVYMGVSSIGGEAPSNYQAATVLCVGFVVLSGADTATGLALAVTIGMLINAVKPYTNTIKIMFRCNGNPVSGLRCCSDQGFCSEKRDDEGKRYKGFENDEYAQKEIKEFCQKKSIHLPFHYHIHKEQITRFRKRGRVICCIQRENGRKMPMTL